MSTPSEPDPRIYFAAERTFLAWIRTGLALMGFGFVVARFGMFLHEIGMLEPTASPQPGLSDVFGVALVALGVVVTGASTASHIATVRRLRRGEPFLGEPSWLAVVLAAVIVIVGVLMTIHLVLTGVE